MGVSGRRAWTAEVLLVTGFFTLSACGTSTGQAGRLTRPSSSSTASAITSFNSPNSDTLWVQLGNGEVFYSSDGGASWDNRTPSNGWVQSTNNQGFGAIGTANTVTPTAAWMTLTLPDGSVQVAITTNQGQTWQLGSLPKTYSESPASTPGVSFPVSSTSETDRPNGWASVGYGNTAYASSDIFRTNDGGKTWTLETTDRLSSGPIEFVTSQVGFNGTNHADNALVETTDGGGTWNSVALPSAPGTQVQMLDPRPVFTDAFHGFVYVNFERQIAQEPYLPYMDLTSDGGMTWTQVALPSPPTQCTSACFPPGPGEGQTGWRGWSIVSPSDWYLIGQDTVMHTTDGGSSWNTLTPNRVLTNLHSVMFPSDQVGYALIDTSTCPDGGVSSSSNCVATTGLLRTADGGATWQQLATP